MAKQVGKIRITGTIGGINFYRSDGQDLARKAGGGFTTDAIKNKPSMESVRKNGTEFGRLSRVKRLLRESILTSLPLVLERKWHSDLVSLLIQIKAQDCSSPRGSRSVNCGLNTAKGMQLMRDFLFTPHHSIATLFDRFPLVSSLGMHCGLSSLQLNKSLFKKDSTPICLHYFVVDYDINALTWTAYSAEKLFISIDELSTPLPDFLIPDLPPVSTFRLAFLGTRFFKPSEGTLVPINALDMVGLRCVGVFCGG